MSVTFPLYCTCCGATINSIPEMEYHDAVDRCVGCFVEMESKPE
jgi:hypothetical protein